MSDLKNITKLTVAIDRIGSKYVMLDVINPDGKKDFISYFPDRARGRWICTCGGDVNDELCNLLDALIAAHDETLPAVEEDLYAREK